MAQGTGIFEPINEAMKRLAAFEPLFWDSVLPSGLAGLDARMGGFRPGELIILASEENWAHDRLTKVFIESAAIKNKSPVAVVRLGHGIRDWCAPIFKSPQSEAWAQAPIYITEPRTGVAIQILVQEIEQLARAVGSLGLIVIDGIDHLNVWADSQFNAENPGASWAAVSSALKWLANNHQCPVIVETSIQNKQPENGHLSEPGLRDLAYEGALANSADLVLMLHDFVCTENGHTASLRSSYCRSGLGVWIDLCSTYETQTWQEIESEVPQKNSKSSDIIWK